MRISLMSLGDLAPDPVTGHAATPAERHRMFVEAAVLADELGYEAVNVGEHHGLDYIFSAPPVILAAIAARTKNLRLSTAVTLLANLDPLRIAEDYATLDAVSGGRAELVAGRGNLFASTYTLFGQDVSESRERFDEAVELFIQLWRGEPVCWNGRVRPPINGERLQPTPQDTRRVPLSIGGGSSKESAELAARLGLDLVLPSAFGRPENFRPIVEYYLERFADHGHDRKPRVGACWHVNVAPTSQAARDRWAPRYRAYFELMAAIIARVNPDPPAFVQKPFDFEFLTTRGPAIVGSPAEVVDRLSSVAEMLTTDTNLLYIDMGGQPAAEFSAMVELLGGSVLPQLRDVTVPAGAARD
jgi:alkanesulfonate monooxygenase SsuD/methylene tetrahydromethanopterin reductase-like flavin-dependent oxidoreductase (luciferase family)